MYGTNMERYVTKSVILVEYKQTRALLSDLKECSYLIGVTSD